MVGLAGFRSGLCPPKAPYWATRSGKTRSAQARRETRQLVTGKFRKPMEGLKASLAFGGAVVVAVGVLLASREKRKRERDAAATPSTVSGVHDASDGSDDPSGGTIVNKFRAEVDVLLSRVQHESWGDIDAAARALADVIAADGIIHVVGAGGHSQIPAFEFYYRAGGLANVSLMIPPGLGLFDAKPGLERIPGMGKLTCAYHNVQPTDAVIITSLYGMNAATIDLALAAKSRGCRLIGLTSVAFSRNTGSDFVARHPSRRNLVDICDIVIDSHTSVDEQLIKVPGVTQKVGVASSLATCFAMQLLTMRTCEVAASRGIDPPVWMSDNLPGGDDANLGYLKRFMPRIRHLYPYTEDFSYDDRAGARKEA